MSRIENKYWVAVENLDEMRELGLNYMNHDYYSEIMKNKFYTVRSVYLDNDQFDAYYEKTAGLEKRSKYRIRAYNQMNAGKTVYCEIKSKIKEYISKERFPIAFNQVADFLVYPDMLKIKNHSADYKLRLFAANNFIYSVKKKNMKPVVNVVYEREAFECKYGSGLRITFDMNLRGAETNSVANLFDEDSLREVKRGYFILEIKYGRMLPSWVMSLVNRFGLIKEAISKYVLCLEESKSNIPKINRIYND
jgi:SPX domain protein involved in polyphosphate accumulation